MHIAPLKQNAGRRYGQEITHSESPLDSLVRKTSSKRLQNPSSRTLNVQPLVWEPYRPSNHQHRPQLPQQVSSSSTHSSNPSFQKQQQRQPNLHLNIEHANRFPNSNALHSPLLHSHFPGRDSVASGDDSFDGGSYIDSTPYDGIYEQHNHHPHPHHHHHHQETDMSHGMDAKSTTSFDGRSDVIDLYFYQPDDESGREGGGGGGREGASNVVVSSPDDNNDSGVRGRAPVVKPVMANFSKPMRDSGQWRQADAVAEKVTPQLPADMQEQKKAVLERNAPRTQTHASTGSVHNRYKPSPLSKHMTTVPVAHQATAQLGPYYNNNGQPSQSATRSTLQPPPMSDMQRRSGSPSSVYSNYSYYQYDGLIPSPVGTAPEQSLTVKASTPRGQSPVGSGEPVTASAASKTPQDYLLLGIDHHEANRLQESVRCFERSAKEGGGCGVGMLMYGLSLRHGWGCTKNEALGFKWVRKAAESAVDDLEKLRTDKTAIDKSSIPAELVLAIYEVGQCFFHGWGVTKNQKMGVSYYTVAARLGDCDAQGDLAFCLANGKGCKKNKKDAAGWYRAAVKQGLSDVGLAWIYKDKYQ